MVISVKRIWIIAFICVFFDQLIKDVLLMFMGMGQSIPLIKGFLSITLVSNTGAAFSMFSSGTIGLIIFSVIALNLIYFLLIKGKNLSKFEMTIYGMLIGGIIGNLIDRIAYFYVIDYLDFNLFGYNFPVFNLADILIVVSLLLFILREIKGDIHDVQIRRK